jgi:hypothetical protein
MCEVPASNHLPKVKHHVATGNSVLCTAFITKTNICASEWPMSIMCDRAKRYCDRAQECLQIVATAPTPGTSEIHLLIAEQYLLLAASEKRKLQIKPIIADRPNRSDE